MKRNWDLGKLIAEEELNGQNRATYGASIIKDLSKRLTAAYGKGFTKSYLYSYVLFYKTHLTIFQSPIGKSDKLLSWTHYYILTQELNDEARSWYEREATQIESLAAELAEKLTAEQEEYLEGILNYVCENGDIQVDVLLTESPFDETDEESVFPGKFQKVGEFVTFLHKSITAA